MVVPRRQSATMSNYFKHQNAIVETERIGRGTRIWAFAHILAGAQIGDDCNICDGVFVENDVVIGDRVTVKCGVQIWDGIRVEDDVFIGPNATFTNDPMPRSMHHLESYAPTIVHRGASIGANATILPGLTIGAGAMVGAGAVVTHSVPAHAVVVGNPAKILRYVDASHAAMIRDPRISGEVIEIRVRGVKLLTVDVIQDLRGNLVAREIGKGLPFVPHRMFLVFDVPSRKVRGEHAHKVCSQLLVAMKGSVSVLCDDGIVRQEIALESPEVGLLLPPLVWGVQYKYTQDAVLLVLASHPYDPSDYIRNYDEFLVALKARV